MSKQEPRWLQWARDLQALAQNGLLYAEDGYDLERYRKIERIAAEMMSAGSGNTIMHVEKLFNKEVGYQTPKVDTRGVVFRNKRLLLVRERQDGLWTLPGGWVDPNETPRQAVEREVMEESGYLVQAVKLLAVLDRAKHGHHPLHPYSVFKLFVHCKLKGGEARESLETDGVAFFGENKIPELSLARVTKSQISRMFEHYNHPEWPADLD